MPVVAVAVALLTLLTATQPASAASAKDKKKRQQQIGQQINQLRGQVEDLSDEEAALSDQVDASHARLADLNAQVADLDTRVAAAEAALGAAQQRLDGAEGDLRDAQARVARLDNELAAARDELRRRAVDAYVAQDRDQMASLVLGLKTLQEVDAALGYAATMVAAQRSAVDRYDALHVQAQDAREEVRSSRDAAAHERDTVATETDRVRADRGAVADARQQAAAEAAHQNDLLNQVQARKDAFETQIANLEAESSSISSFLAALPPGTGGIVVSGKGIFSIPIPGAPIVSGFGPRVHPIFHTVRVHTGIDFAATTGTPIRAAADGTVVMAGTYGGYGNATIIDHGNNAATLYGHQSRILVSQGDHVVRGQVIGLVGSTGFSTGPHLHFEVRLGGTPVDPRPYL